jgi:hypothetical protein
MKNINLLNVIKKINLFFKSFSVFDWITLMFSLLIIPCALVLIHIAGYYCYYEDFANDCPANNSVYYGQPFWSITAITSNFIHNKEFTKHLLPNIGIYAMCLLVSYVFIGLYFTKGLIKKVWPFSLGILLNFSLAVTAVSFLGMTYLRGTYLFGKPSFGFSGVSFAFVGFFLSLILTLFLIKRIKKIDLRYLSISALIFITAIISLREIILLISKSEGNVFVHIIGILFGLIAGIITFLIYYYKAIKYDSQQI